MEPMLPEEAERGLDDLTVELVAEAHALAGRCIRSSATASATSSDR